MKQKIFTGIIAIFCLSAVYAQEPRLESGMKFDFNAEQEENPAFVLVDDYNHYLVTDINIHGMLNIHKILIRKFDQANQLLETFTQEFPKIDANTLYNYNGAFEIGNGKLAIFTNIYSNKAKKQEVYMHIFDKKSAAFTTTKIADFAIESAMKSANVNVVASENGRYIGIKIQKDKTKTEPFTDEIIIWDAATSSQVWNKKVEFIDKYVDKSFAVTNSGKAVILRQGEGFNMHNYLVVVTADKQEEKQFEDKIMLHKPRVVTIGSKEYLIDFNYPAKGLRAGDYDNFIFYDLEAGKTIVNNKLDVGVFSKTPEIKEVYIRSIFLQNDEIHIFAEGRVRAGSREEKVNAMSSTTMTVDYYKFSPARQIVLGFDGNLKKVTNINVGSSQHLTNLYFSFGVVNVRGEYYINSDGARGLYDLNSGKKMIIDAKTDQERERNSRILRGDTESSSKEYVNQLCFYINNSRKLVVARIHPDKRMSLLSIFDPF